MEAREIKMKYCFKYKGSMSYLVGEETETVMVDDEEVGMHEKKKRGMCQVENCGADLTQAKQYHRRHKVCEVHAKAPAAIVAGLMQRFCQQCSRFHELSEFDEAKRSCRSRLAGHNERRRKSSSENSSEGPGQRGVNSQFIQTQDRNRLHMRVSTRTSSSSSKRSQII